MSYMTTDYLELGDHNEPQSVDNHQVRTSWLYEVKQNIIKVGHQIGLDSPIICTKKGINWGKTVIFANSKKKKIGWK